MSLMIEGGRRLPEYSRGVIKAASRFVIAGLYVASCRAEIQGTSTPEIFTVEPSAPETLSPTPEPDRVPGVSYPESQLIAVGRSIGSGGESGGEGSLEPPVYINSNLQSKLINSGLRPIIDSERNNLLTQTLVSADGQRVCFPNVPDVLYNPELGQDDHIRDENLLRLFGNKSTGQVRFEAVTAVSLNGFAKDVVCVNSIAAAGRNNIFNVSPGTVVTVLMNKDTSEIYGGFNSVYAQSDNVVFDQATARITVNGRDVWFEGPRMAELESQLNRAPDGEEIKSRVEQQGQIVEIKELDDGTEVVARTKEISVDLSQTLAPYINKPLVFQEEQILAFSSEINGAYMIEGGQIIKWVDGDWRSMEMPYGVGEIAFFEIYLGEWYGISSSNRAVVKLNGEANWEEYSRPLIVALPKDGEFPEEILQDIALLQEGLDEEEELRLVNNKGDEIPFGYLQEVSFREDGRPTHVFVSGYPLAVIDYVVRDYRLYKMLFEIPLRYERQIVIVELPNQSDTFSNLDLIPDSRNMDERNRRPRPWVDLLKAIQSSDAVGNQMVFAFQINWPPSEILAERYNHIWNEWASNLRLGKATEANAYFVPSFTFVDENLFR